MPIEKKCKVCGKAFSVPPSRKDTAMFCSPGCKGKGAERKRSVKATCAHCGKTFLVFPAWVRKGGGKYCSKVCKDADQIAAISVSKAKRLYFKDNLSTEDIGRAFGVSGSAVRRLFYREGIKLRSAEEAQRAGPVIKKRSGPNSKSWKGGRIIHQGYVEVLLPGHRLASKRGRVKEHRLVWEQTHQCVLPQSWHVHHRNKKRDDNRPENLLGLSKKNHSILENAIRLGQDTKELEDRFAKLEQEYINKNQLP